MERGGSSLRLHQNKGRLISRKKLRNLKLEKKERKEGDSFKRKNSREKECTNEHFGLPIAVFIIITASLLLKDIERSQRLPSRDQILPQCHCCVNIFVSC